MATRDTQYGRPSWSLSPQSLSIAYGQAQFMSSTGEANASGWFGPLAPLGPIAPPQVAGRQFDFPSGYNIAVGARAFEPIGFHDLRALAETYDLLRLVIETRKDQVERISWSLRARPGASGPGSARISALTAFFERPDGEHCFSAWLRMLLEDLFVIDAPTLWRQRARNGTLVALHPLDGATFKRVIDDWGRTPQPFYDNGALVHPVAYQQILKGYPAVDYAARDILYAPRNPRTGRVYGLSPVEQIVMTASIALKRQTFTLSHFTEGNIPESLIGVPEAWTPDQIKNFQDYWDAYFTGDLAARRRAKFVPGGVAKTFIQTKEPELKNAFDEWLARLVCYAFSVSPQAFVAHINRATGETQKEMAEEEGLWPVLKWIKRLIDRVLVEDFGESELEFVWGDDAQIDAEQQQRILVGYVNAGILTRNEARARLGERPAPDAGADALMVTGSGAAALGAPHDPRELEKAYNPDQPRDWHGRFGEGGGNAKPKAKTQVAHDTTRTNDAASDAGGAITDAARAAATLAAPGLVGAEAARRAVQWLSAEPKEPASSDNAADVKRSRATSAAPAPPPEDEPGNRKETKDMKTIRPSAEDIQRLMVEHSDPKGLPLTTNAANAILDETQPQGTKATIVGKNVAGPDIIYEDANGAPVTSVEVKTAKNLDAAEAATKRALDKNSALDVVALQAPKDMDILRFTGKIRNLSQSKKAGRSILVVDQDGKLLLPLQPFP
jgi:hypothetical protein